MKRQSHRVCVFDRCWNAAFPRIATLGASGKSQQPPADEAGHLLQRCTANCDGGSVALPITQGDVALSYNGGTQTLTQNSYDADGVSNSVTMSRDMWQCAPSICGGSNQQSRPALHYTYDLGGAVLSAFDGVSGNIVYTRSPAGEITSVTNQTYTAPGDAPNLVSNVTNTVNGPTLWTFGNGVQAVRSYDGLGRPVEVFDCAGTNQTSCSGGNTVYGYARAFHGARVTRQCDSVLGSCQNHSYDDFNRLTAVNGDNNAYSYGYGYDRWGNRTVANGMSYSFNTSTNQQVNNGYDAAGN